MQQNGPSCNEKVIHKGLLSTGCWEIWTWIKEGMTKLLKGKFKDFIFYQILISFSVVQQPNSGSSRLIFYVYRPHTIRYTHACGRIPLNEWAVRHWWGHYLPNIRQTQETNTHFLYEIRTHDHSNIKSQTAQPPESVRILLGWTNKRGISEYKRAYGKFGRDYKWESETCWDRPMVRIIGRYKHILKEWIWNFFGAIQMISCHVWWPCTKPGYTTMTRRQSNNQWSGGIAPHPAPKNSECKNPLENFSPQFFGIKTASYSLIIFQRAKLLTRSALLEQLKDSLKEKCRGKFTKLSCSCTTMPRLTGHLQHSRNWPTWASSVLITHPPDLAPSDHHLFPGMKKTIESSPFCVRLGCHCCRGDLVEWTNFWILFECLAKVRATG